MRPKKVPPWIAILRQAKERGNVNVHAFAMTADLLRSKKEHFDRSSTPSSGSENSYRKRARAM